MGNPIQDISYNFSFTLLKRSSAHGNLKMKSNGKKKNSVRFADDPVQYCESPQRTITKPLQPLSGLFFALLSGLFFSVSSILVRDLQYLHPGQLCLYRFLGIFSLSIPDIIRSGQPVLLPKSLFVLVFFRSIFATTNMFLNIVSFELLHIGEAAVILFSVPVFVTVAASLFLLEPCGYFQSVTILMTVAGTILSAKLHDTPSLSFIESNVLGIMTSVFSLMCNTSNLIFLRLVVDVHRSAIMFHLGWWAIIQTSAITLISGHSGHIQCGDHIWVLLLGLLSYFGQLSLTAAIKKTYAGPVAMGRAAAEIVSFFGWQMIMVEDFPDLRSIVGVCLVVLSMIIVLCKTWYETSLVDSKSFQRLQQSFR